MPSNNSAIDVKQMLNAESLACSISDMYMEFEMKRNQWIEDKKELREYIFATDTSSTSNSTLPWKNSVHVPKLCQIRDNLHANYMAAIFPNDRALIWEGDDDDSEDEQKRLAIQSYMENKLNQGKFRVEVSKLLYDWIDWGVCFAMPVFEAQYTDIDGERIPGFIGPKLERIGPLDIVFNPAAASFEKSPKIIRSIKTIASLLAEIQDDPSKTYLQEVVEKFQNGRQRFNGATVSDYVKSSWYQIDGFGSYVDYFQSDYVEVLDFYGDVYDRETGELYRNYMITVIDRAYVARKIPNPSWLGGDGIRMCGWRIRPDNLYAMGPLDNLVGMQYRIDHLENLKSDVFDLIAHPVFKIKGYVDDFTYEPNARIICGDEGDVEFMHPDVTALQADTQIMLYEQKMEEMAGAPKHAMGFRTPGEKTAYEVQILENGANRIFLNKTSYFEEVFLEPLLNDMLEFARRNMTTSDVVRVLDNDIDVVNFLTITREDITASGRIRPVGARHFARNANIIQNLTQFYQTMGQDQSITAHISGKKVANLMEELLGLKRYDLVQDNIRVLEQAETQKLISSAEQLIMEQNASPTPGLGQNPATAGGTQAAPAGF